MSIPKEIRKKGNKQLKITWEDGHVTLFDFRLLRQNCPCASCVSELTGERTLHPESVPEGLEATKAEIVGNYALRFQFSDGHHTGIYTFEKLRELCPCCRNP